MTSIGSAGDAFIGFGVGISSSSRRAIGDTSTFAQTPSSHAAFNQNAYCIYTPSGSAKADFVSCDSDGFTINLISTSSGMLVNYLALGGDALTNYKLGTLTDSGATGNQTISGVGFQPDTVLFFAGKYSTEPLDQSTNGAAMFGFAKSSSQRGVVSWRSKSGANPQVAKHRQSTSKCIISLTDSGVFAEADYVSSDSDGFTVNYTTAGGASGSMYYLALKGPNFKIVSFNQPTSTGNQTLTGAGFTPKASLFFSNNDIAANNDSTLAHSRLSLGVATGTGTNERSCIWSGEADVTIPTNTARYMERAKVIKLMTEGATPTLNAEADHSSFNSDGQVLNWTTVDATARQIIGLWLG